MSSTSPKGFRRECAVALQGGFAAQVGQQGRSFRNAEVLLGP